MVQYHRRSDDVWSVNIAGAALEYCSMHWNMDDLRAYGASAEIVRLIRESNKEKNHDTSIMTSRWYPEYPECIQYSLKLVLNHFKDEICWFNHTPSYMFPYAIMQGFDEIHLHGFDYLGTGVRTAQYLNTLMWIGIATKHKVRVRYNPVSVFMRDLYYKDKPFTFRDVDWKIDEQFYGYCPQPEGVRT